MEGPVNLDGDEHKVQFLREVFPSLTPDVIKQRIKRAPPEQSDVDSLVTYFLGFCEDSSTASSSTSPIIPIFSALTPDLSDSDVVVVVDDIEKKSKKDEERRQGEEGEEVFEMITLEPTTWNDGLVQKEINPFESEITTTTTTTTITTTPPKDTPKSVQNKPILTKNIQKPSSNSPSRSSFLASIHEKRVNNHNSESNFVNDRKTSSNVPSYYDQIKSIREKHRSQWRSTSLGKKRVWSLRDLEEYENNNNKIDTESSFQSKKHNSGVHTFQNTIYDPVRMGKEALEYTNNFRKEQRLPPLKWHAGLYPIACKHSKDMADGVVPFGHQGFDKRVASYPFSFHTAAENVAMNRGFGDVARIAVDGWIQSPGHRKNLLSRSIHCTIGVHQADNGAWYLTQLFAG